jgi:phosphate starvation-inducible membrane PsiE
VSPREPEPPPLGEEIHLPAPSLIPVGVAVGVALMIVGLTVTPILIVAGAILTLVLVVRWIRVARREIGELPVEQR